MVLVVDDDPLIVEIFRLAFAPHPEYLLDVAMSITDALDKLKVLCYDVVFLDMKLDTASFFGGMQILRELNRIIMKATVQHTMIPNSLVIVMSSSVNLHEVMHEANELGVLCFMDKPVTFSEEFVRRILQRVGVFLLPPRTENGIK